MIVRWLFSSPHVGIDSSAWELNQSHAEKSHQRSYDHPRLCHIFVDARPRLLKSVANVQNDRFFLGGGGWFRRDYAIKCLRKYFFIFPIYIFFICTWILSLLVFIFMKVHLVHRTTPELKIGCRGRVNFDNTALTVWSIVAVCALAKIMNE